MKTKHLWSILLVVGLVLSVFGSYGFVSFSYNGSAGMPTASTSKTEPVVEQREDQLVYGEDMSLYLPKADNVVTDEETGITFINNEILVMFKTGTADKAARDFLKTTGGEVKGYLPALDRYEVVFPDVFTLRELELKQVELEKKDIVEIAYTNFVMEVGTQEYNYKDNARWKDSWSGAKVADGNWGMEAINAPKLWEYYDEMGTVKVGVLDGGFYKHDDLKIMIMEPNVQTNHGTHVAGTIGATNNSIGVVGVAPTSKLYGISLYGFAGALDAFETVSFLEPIIFEMTTTIEEFILLTLVDKKNGQGCSVINYSMGELSLRTFAASRGDENARNAFRRYSEPTRNVLAKLLRKNDFLFVSSAGNENERESSSAKTAMIGSACTYDNLSKQYRDYIDGRFFVKDSEQKYGYRETKSYEEFLSSDNGDLNSAFNSAYAFIGSQYDTKEYDKETGLWRDYSEDTKKLVRMIRNHVIVVGNAQLDGANEYSINESSRHGARVDIAAPGTDIDSTINDSQYNLPGEGTEEYDSKSGTSMAAPHVAGAAAAIWSMDWTLTGAEVKKILIDTAATDIGYINENLYPERYPFLDAGEAAEKVHNDKVSRGIVSTPVVLSVDDSGSRSTNSLMSMVFDVSGSMSASSGSQRTEYDPDSGRDITTNLSKMDAAKEASIAVLTNIRGIAERYDDRYSVGIAQFDNSGMDIISPTANYDVVQMAIDGLHSDGGTNVYEGLRIGIEQLDGQDGVKTMIFLSDGIDESGNSNESLLEMARTAASKDITIHTIGFGHGSDIDEELLKSIAQATGGTYSFADASNAIGITASFVSAQKHATSAVLAEETSEIRQGRKSSALTVPVPPLDGDLNASLYWQDSDLDIVLKDPEGNLVDEEYPGATVDDLQIPAQITVSDPVSGGWSLSVHGKDVSAQEEPYYLVSTFVPLEEDFDTNGSDTSDIPIDAVVSKTNIPMPLEMWIAAVCFPTGIFFIILSWCFMALNRNLKKQLPKPEPEPSE